MRGPSRSQTFRFSSKLTRSRLKLSIASWNADDIDIARGHQKKASAAAAPSLRAICLRRVNQCADATMSAKASRRAGIGCGDFFSPARATLAPFQRRRTVDACRAIRQATDADRHNGKQASLLQHCARPTPLVVTNRATIPSAPSIDLAAAPWSFPGDNEHDHWLTNEQTPTPPAHRHGKEAGQKTGKEICPAAPGGG